MPGPLLGPGPIPMLGWSFGPIASMSGGMFMAAPGNGQPVGFGFAILAVPLSIPVKAVPLINPPAVQRDNVAWSSPLLKAALSVRLGGSAAFGAGLHFSH